MRFDALNAGCYDKGQLKYVGKVRNGFSRIMRRASDGAAAAVSYRRMPRFGPA
jgi:ATP-dependent DNA ligase